MELPTRAEFDRKRAVARTVTDRHGRRLAAFSVAGGVIQLLFLKWADAHLDRGPRNTIAGLAFLSYAGAVIVLLARMQRAVRGLRPVCPHCGVRLDGMSERVAAATGKCDQCGGEVVGK